jgi:drug/metabolite transporter (DMT)-like permease
LCAAVSEPAVRVLLGDVLSVACAVFWSCATVLFRKSGERIPPVALNVFKNAVAFVLFAVTLPVVGVPFLPAAHPAGDWLVLLASGAVGIGIADTLFFACLNRLGAGGSAVVTCLYPAFTVLAAFAWLGEPIGPSLLLGGGLMIAAILVGTWEPRAPRTPAERRQVTEGVIHGTLSVLFMAVAIVYAKPVLDRGNPWWTTTVRILGGVVFLGVQGLLPRHRAAVARAFRPDASWRVSVLGAFLGSYVAMILWIVGMTWTHVSTASVLNQTSTIFTLVLGVLFLRERLTLRKAAAVVLAFAGTAIVFLWAPG